MTEKEAIESLETLRIIDAGNLNDAVNLAQKALKNQILKTPISYGADYGKCPNCKYEFNSELWFEYDMKYCPNCGQCVKL